MTNNFDAGHKQIAKAWTLQCKSFDREYHVLCEDCTMCAYYFFDDYLIGPDTKMHQSYDSD